MQELFNYAKANNATRYRTKAVWWGRRKGITKSFVFARHEFADRVEKLKAQGWQETQAATFNWMASHV